MAVLTSLKVNAFPFVAPGNFVRELQVKSEEELSALMPSVLRPQGEAFKGES